LAKNSQEAYRWAVEDFIRWYESKPGRPPPSKALVQDYRAFLVEQLKVAPSSVNVRLAAIHKLESEAADNGLPRSEPGVGNWPDSDLSVILDSRAESAYRLRAHGKALRSRDAYPT